MLSLVLTVPIIVFGIWLIVRVCCLFWQYKAKFYWWLGLLAILLAGVFGGWRLSHLDLRLSPEIRLGGVPFPIGFLKWEGDHWTDFVPPYPNQWINIVADIFLPIILMLFPLFAIWKRRKTRDSQGMESLS